MPHVPARRAYPGVVLATLALTATTVACVDTDRARPVAPEPEEDAGASTIRDRPDAAAATPDAGTLPTGDPDAAVDPPPADAGPPAGNPDASAPLGLAVLGHFSHSPGEVLIEEVGRPADGLNLPRDLAFNPDRPGELWVVNRADDSTVIYFDVGTAAQRSEWRLDPYALHFMEEVSSIAFGAPGTFGTCQESRNTYDDTAPPNDFMGPVLWSSDLDVFAHTNPEAVQDIGGNLGSHLDMLHESPLCMGIAWESDNIYWAFDGAMGSLSRNDFQRDHGPGYDDHSDGIIERFEPGAFLRVADVPSHLERDPATGIIYVADTGNARIAALDPTGATRGRRLREKEAGTLFVDMDGAVITTLVDRTGGELVRPSGIALAGGLLYVTDNATSRISAFDLTGARIDWLDTGLAPGSLMGLVLDAAGRIYLVDAVEYRVLRISPKP